MMVADSVKRPLGAYYRVTLDALSDIHIALVESGAVYASALTHGGWEELFVDNELPAPTSSDEIPVIECRGGQEDGGHAFAIVGYTDKGFVVHNSWGPTWGRGGFGILTYSDWRQNAMDAWVVQLGVVTKEHEAVAKATGLRVTDRASGRVVVSSSPRLASHEISPFVVNMQNEGRLSERGEFRTFESDLTFCSTTIWTKKPANCGSSDSDVVDVALYALRPGNERRRGHGPRMDTSLVLERIFPVFLIWKHLLDGLQRGGRRHQGRRAPSERGFVESLQDRIATEGRTIEGLTRAGGAVCWAGMKDNASDISGTKHQASVSCSTFQSRRQVASHSAAPCRSSAGAIVHTFSDRAPSRPVSIGTVNLIAPRFASTTSPVSWPGDRQEKPLDACGPPETTLSKGIRLFAYGRRCCIGSGRSKR